MTNVVPLSLDPASVVERGLRRGQVIEFEIVCSLPGRNGKLQGRISQIITGTHVEVVCVTPGEDHGETFPIWLNVDTVKWGTGNLWECER